MCSIDRSKKGERAIRLFVPSSLGFMKHRASSAGIPRAKREESVARRYIEIIDIPRLNVCSPLSVAPNPTIVFPG